MASPESNCAHQFSWEEIPFEPLGVDTGKYPILRAEDFDELQKAAKLARQERKFDIRLLRAPQGAGKTALSTEVKNTFLKNKDTFVIFHQLISMEPLDLTKQVFDQAKTNRTVSESFLNSLNFDSGKIITKPELRQIVLSILEEAIKEKNLGIWIVDEFDTISSAEASEGEKSEFLQWLRSIIDGIANSKKIHGKGFLIIMAHTEKSAEEFGKELKNLHGPLQERLMSTGTIEIGYKLHEVRNIILERINFVKLDKTESSSISPFTDEAISLLFELVNDITGTREMISFRLFEKSCYEAIINACEKNLKEIDAKQIEESFYKIQKTLGRDDTVSNLSTETRMDINKILRADQIAKNTTILEGIGKGITNFMGSVLEDVNILNSRFIKQTETGLFISEIKFVTEPKTKKSDITSVWYCVSKEKESFTKNDFDEIEKELKHLKDDRMGINLTMLCIVTDKEDVPLDEVDIKKKITSIDELFLIDKRLMKNLISLGCCREPEVTELQQPFDQYIKSKFIDSLSSQVQDITYAPSETVLQLVNMLNLLDVIGEDATGPHLQTVTGTFYNKTKPQPRAIREMIQLGFANEASGNLIPAIPKTLQSVFDLIKINKKDLVEKNFPKPQKILKTAIDLSLVDSNENAISIDNLKEQSNATISEARELLQKEGKDDSKIYNDIRKLINAYDKIDSISSQIRKIILIQFVQKEIRIRLKQIADKKSSATQTKVSYESEQPQESETKDMDFQTSKITQQSFQPTYLDDDQLMGDITKILSNGPKTLPELALLLQKQKYPPDIRQKLFFFVKSGRLKISA